MLFHGRKADGVGIAKILVLIFSQDILGILFQCLVRVDLTDPWACTDVSQKRHGRLMTHGAAYQDVGFGYDEVCCGQMTVVLKESWINSNGLIVILIRFVSDCKPRACIHKYFVFLHLSGLPSKQRQVRIVFFSDVFLV